MGRHKDILSTSQVREVGAGGGCCVAVLFSCPPPCRQPQSGKTLALLFPAIVLSLCLTCTSHRCPPRMGGGPLTCHFVRMLHQKKKKRDACMAPRGQGVVVGGGAAPIGVSQIISKSGQMRRMPSLLLERRSLCVCVCVVVYRVILGPSSFAISGEVPLRERSCVQAVQGLPPPWEVAVPRWGTPSHRGAQLRWARCKECAA